MEFISVIICIILFTIPIFIARQLYLKEKGIRKGRIKITGTENIGLKLVCFLLPIVGVIVYAVNIVQNPKIAKECGIYSLIGFCAGIVITIVVLATV